MATHNTKNIIEINGKRYDATTGAYLGEQPQPVSSHTSAAPARRSVDGFPRAGHRDHSPVMPARSLAPQVRVESAAVTAQAAAAVSTANRPRKAHEPAVTVKAHRPQPAKTLMRTAVKKPAVKSPAVIKAQTRTDALAKVPSQTVVPKLSHTKVDPKRLRRAERIIQSPTVSKYAKEQATSAATPVLLSHIPATTTKAAQPAVRVQPGQPVRSGLRSPHQAPFRSDIRAHRAMAQRRMPSAQHGHAPAKPQTPQLTQDVFAQALAEATAHEQAYRPAKKRRSLATMAGVTVSMALLVAFLTYQNMPYINVRIAAHRSGIQAKMPGHGPVGFSFGSLTYTQGNVTVNYFGSQDKSQSLRISQESSEWDSKALLDNFVSTTSKSYDTIERAGRTIYLYGNNAATWVDNGVWYVISGDNKLSDTQILDVALSM